KADPTNYTLTLLRSKLDAQQKLQARQQQEAQQKAQRAAELATAQQTAAAKAAGVTRGAQMVKAAAAQYPLAAARNQTSGYAVVEFTVTSTGSVTSAHVVESSPRRVFDQA